MLYVWQEWELVRGGTCYLRAATEGLKGTGEVGRAVDGVLDGGGRGRGDGGRGGLGVGQGCRGGGSWGRAEDGDGGFGGESEERAVG